jgi:hypothetical protein
MAKHLLKLLPFVLLFLSCEKSDIDSNYPTTFNKLSTEKLSQERTTFSSINKYLTTTLNDFGFCGYSGDPLIVESPPLQDLLTQSEAIEIVKNFALKNPSETGIKNPNDLTFYQISSNTGYDGANGWLLKSSFQKIDTVEVMYSEIIFHIKNREVTFCIGNWFPDIYVPKHFNINQDKAKTLLINKVVSHTSIGGEKNYVTISAGDLNESTVKLKILPITSDDRIELRIGWQINIPGPVYYIIYVDVMTGDIIGQEPTIIS